MISCKNITKSYQNIAVLRGVSLDLAERSLTSIVGSSGAGKSTLLHVLGTLDKPDQGSIFLAGVDVTKLNSKQLADFRNKEIGFIFQFHHLLPEFSALENVSLPGLIAKKDERQVQTKARELLSILGMSERFDHKPSQLSGGEQQRVAIARALINSPKILFADEPTGNLDQKNANEVFELLLMLRREFGLTMVIVTHDISLADKTDQKLIMRDGIIVSN
ncbi:MAG TPA: ABC transporter ATP-binding protein [Saprospiraceae bacterium]|jgi:lipoprotein-releasing system ATP-binding protein|nr:ABC transporter ATP-binding protein [Saprospiraceae bacterium]